MKKYRAVLLIFNLLILAGCGKNQYGEIRPVEEIPIESLLETVGEETEELSGKQDEISAETVETSKEGEEASIGEIENDTLFSKLKNIDFSFMSGAGAWATELVIQKDGSFHGLYHDSDMGSTSEEYPNGSRYYSSFHGKLKEPIKIDDFTYSTAIESITYDNPVGTEEIIDGIRYLYSEAYGLESSDEILIYLPGIPVQQLSEEYLSWVKNNWGSGYENKVSETELPFYGLYNVEQGLGFSGNNILMNFNNTFKQTEEVGKVLEKSLQQDYLTQLELNETSQQLYDIWDNELNNIWDILKRNLLQEDMAELTKEQLEWIAMKEKSMKDAGKDVEGGSMYNMVINLRGVELTKERVYLLLEKIEVLKEAEEAGILLP